MVRTKEFDEMTVLLAAAEVFAKNGYAGSSIDQLVRATGLLRGSLYSAFYSKSGLFNTALKQQLEGKTTDLLTDLLIVALFERSEVDKIAAELTREAIQKLEDTLHQSFESILAQRILARACLTLNNKGEK